MVSVSPPLSPSGPSIGSATSGFAVHSEPAGHCRLPPPSVCMVSHVGLYIAVLLAISVFTRVRPSPKIPPDTTLSPGAWLLAIVQLVFVPVGPLPSHDPPPLDRFA